MPRFRRRRMMMEEQNKYSEDYQRLLGRLILDEDFRDAVLGDDKDMRTEALASLKIQDEAVHDEIATYLRYRRDELSELLEYLHDDVSFMA
jgi:hypothetical protein